MLHIGPYKITSPYILAPMAGVSEMAFRVIAFELGAGLATTELISAKGIFHRNQRTEQYLRYDAKIEKPYSLQLFGGDEESMAHAAVKAAEIGAQIIDINMGCPVKKVTKTGAGSSLLCDPKRAASLVKAMRNAVGDAVPITVKIRSGWDADSINCLDMGLAMQDAGCAAIALHARTRAQGYSGKADWNLIKQLKQSLQIPVIGNGDVVTREDAIAMQTQTGCDAVMIGRGALGNPWVFSDHKPSTQERMALVLRHFNSHLSVRDDELRAIRSFRTHLVWYSRGLRDASQFREKVMHLEGRAAVEDAVAQFFAIEHDSETDADDGVDYRQAFG